MEDCIFYEDEDEGRGSPEYHEDRWQTERALSAACVPLMENLVRTGRCQDHNFRMYPSYLYEEWDTVYETLRLFCNFVVHDCPRDQWIPEIAKSSADYAYNFTRSIESSSGLLPARLVILCKILEGVTRMRGEDPQFRDYASCIRLIFETVTDPIVSQSEIRNLVLSVPQYLPPNPPPLRLPIEELAESVCEDVVRVFPESAIPYQPRSLKHLCRCAVRTEHRKYGPELFRESIEGLRIPRSLKLYLLAA